MKERYINWVSMGASSLLGLSVLLWWFIYDPTENIILKSPGMDNRPAKLPSAAETIKIGEYFERFTSELMEISGSWERFRGPDFDNINKEKIKLVDNWSESGPKILWSIELGEGHAAPAVYGGKIYLLDYNEEKKADALRCFFLEDGREIWQRWYNVEIKRNHGMSRTIPAVSNKYVVTMGPRCHVMCVDTDSGTFRWSINLEKEYGTEVPLWYTGQCPLIDNSIAVIAPTGNSLMIGVDCDSGKVVWQTPNPNDWKMSHSSIIKTTFFGKKMYVYAALGGVVGISAEGENRGQILWETNLFNHSVVAPAPVILPDNRIYLTAGYGAGSIVIKIVKENDSYRAELSQKLTPKEGFASEQQTPILYQNHLFGILPKDAGGLKTQFVCCSPEDCSNILWSSGKTHRFGLGPFIIADNKFFILSDDGELTVAKVSTKEYQQLAKAKILDGVDAWGPLAIVNGRLLARDSKTMVCVDLRKGK
jgi:outer membrane protein assembly factor BamB